MENDNIQTSQSDLKRFVYLDQINNVTLSFDLELKQVPAFRGLLMRAYIDLGPLVDSNIKKV